MGPQSQLLTARQDKAHFKKHFSPENGGFAPGLNWYIAQLNDANKEDEAGTSLFQNDLSFDLANADL
jgi:hypothetical protein